MKNRPAYSVASVDHALRLAQMLQQEGPLRVTEAAARLGVARSTAHRLLAMLVYRDFAEQGDDRQYVAGPALRGAPPTSYPVGQLRDIALPHLQALMHRTDETCNLQIRVGDQTRFIATAECQQVLRVGNRDGRILPAHLTSGGKALLAELSEPELRALYAQAPDVDLPRLSRQLRLVRRRGFAINNQQTERGVTAFGRAVHGPDGKAVAAVTLSTPSTRFHPTRLTAWLEALARTTTAIGAELSATVRPSGS